MIQRFNKELLSGILLASMPKSGSTFTTNNLSQKENIRVDSIAPNMDPHGVLDHEIIDIKMLATALNQNKNSSFVARQHVVFTSITLELIKRKYLVPLVLTRNLPDAIISTIDHRIITDLKEDKTLMPKNFDRVYNIEQKCDYFIHFLLPWYLRFFASWIRYDEFPKVWLRYEDLTQNNQIFINKVTSILGIEDLTIEKPDKNKVVTSVDDWKSNSLFNKGVNGRGQKIMTSDQIKLIRKMIELYDIPHDYRNYLLTGKI